METTDASKGGVQPRRHHVVPRCYLDGFTLPSTPNRLYAIDAKRGTDYEANPANLVVERDFYRAENKSGDPYLVEKKLSESESLVTPVLRRIDQTLKLPTGEDLHHLIFFIANLWARARHFRATLDDFVGRISRKIAWDLIATRERWDGFVAKAKADGITLPTTDYEGMRAFIQSDDYEIRVDRGWLIRQMLESTVTVFDLLVHRRWVLSATPDNGLWLVTSDEPVGLRWIKPVTGWPPGFGLRNTVLTVPLSKRCFLEGYLPDDRAATSADVVHLDARQVAWHNSRTIELAGDVVLAPDKHFISLDDTGNQLIGADILRHIQRRIEERRSAPKPRP